MLLIISQGLGTIGIFRPPAVAASFVVVGSGCVALARRWPRSGQPRGVSAPPARGLARVASLAMATMVAGQWAQRSVRAAFVGITDNDSLYYHLQEAARFVQDGRITAVNFTGSDPLSAYYPANVELFNALSIMPFHRDIVSPFLNLGWMVLALVAAWCIGLPFDAAPSTTAVTAVVLATPVMLRFEAGTAQVDVGLLALLLAACALLLHGKWQAVPVGLAGLAAGLAVGTKFTMLPPVVVLTAAVVLLAPRTGRARLGAMWVLGVATTGSFWYVRNVVRVGNPVPGLGGVGPFRLRSPASPAFDRYGFSVAHYVADRDFWASAWPALRGAFGPLWGPLLLLAAAGAILAVAKGPTALVRAVGLVSMSILGTYLVTPFTALGLEGVPFVAPNLRFLPAFLCLALIGLLLTTSGAYRSESVVLGLCAFGVLGMALASAGMVSRREAAISSIAVVAALAAALALFLTWAAARPTTRAILLCGGVLLGGSSGWVAQERMSSGRYVGAYGPDGVVWEWAQRIRNDRIGVVGYTRGYPFYGRDLSNIVRYLGRETADGGFSDIPDCRSFIAEVAGEAYGYVVTGPVKVSRLLEPKPEPEAGWLRSQPGAAELLRAGDLSVFRLDRKQPVDPMLCP